MSFGNFDGSSSLGNLIFLGPWSCSSDVGLTDGISNSFWLPVKLHLGASNRHGLPVFGLSRSASAAGLGPSANMPTCNLSRKGVYTTLAHCRRSFQEVLRDVARNSFGNFRATYSSLRALSWSRTFSLLGIRSARILGYFWTLLEILFRLRAWKRHNNFRCVS